jgi:hypothetical protein
MSVTPPTLPAETHEAPAFLSHRAYTSPFLVRRKSKESGTKSAQTAAARLARKTQSFSEGLEPSSGERLADIDVFLGGSCNPTTWRRDVTIPMLDGAHVKYFNPQVDEWFEELIQIETRAKETAKIVLMVIDNLTRSIVCINEAVEYICRGRRVVVVVQDIEPGTAVDGKTLTPSELGDLNGARECLRSLARRKEAHGSDVHLYPDVMSATDAVITWVTNGDLPRHAPEVPRLRKRSSIVLSAWSGHFRFGRRASRSSSSNALASVVHHKNAGSSGVPGAGHGINRSIVRYGGAKRNGSVYLGGDLAGTSWREEIAIPLLHKAGIPFYIPYTDYLSFGLTQKSERLTRFPADRWKEIETEKELAEVSRGRGCPSQFSSTRYLMQCARFAVDPVRDPSQRAVHRCHDGGGGAAPVARRDPASDRADGGRVHRRGEWPPRHRARVQGPGTRARVLAGDR